MGEYFLGIDPGQTGGAAVIDRAGAYVLAWRWDIKAPATSYNKLLYFKGSIIKAYIEIIRIFPRETKGFITQGQGVIKNSGIWLGWLMALGLDQGQISYIDPITWQAPADLHHWQNKQKANPTQHSPLTLARSLYPGAPLEFQADDGKAVALLLARLARGDHLVGINRNQIKAQALEKRKAQKRRARQTQQNTVGPLTGVIDIGGYGND